MNAAVGVALRRAGVDVAESAQDAAIPAPPGSVNGTALGAGGRGVGVRDRRDDATGVADLNRELPEALVAGATHLAQVGGDPR